MAKTATADTEVTGLGEFIAGLRKFSEGLTDQIRKADATVDTNPLVRRRTAVKEAINKLEAVV